MKNGLGSDRRVPDGGTEFVAEYDEDESPSEAVLRSVATITGVTAVELDPLYETIDPDALDALFEGNAPASVTFFYAGCRVVVEPDRVRVETRHRKTTPFPSDSGDS